MKITGLETIQKILLGEFKHRQKLKFKGKEYSYDADFKDFINKGGNGQYTLIYENNMTLKDFLEAEFELIEENKEIEEVENITYNFSKTAYTPKELNENFETMTELLNKQSNKINELVRAVNKLIKEREEK